MNWHNVLLRPQNLYEELLRRKLISGGGVPAVLQTITGISPLTLLNVASRGIKSLTQFGKCEQASSPTPSVPVDIKCNNGTIKAKHESGLPIEYQKVEYIKSSGTQYVDIGYIPDGNEIIELTFDLVNLPIQSKWIVLFGEREQAASTSQTNYWLGINNTGALYSRFGTVNASSQPTLTSGTTYNIKVDVPNRTLYVNNDSYTFTDSVISDITKSIFLGNINAPVGATLNLGGTANYRSMKITKNDNILHNFIPCYRKSDNEAGLYDIVTNTFFANAGTGSFAVGSDVADSVEIYADGTPEVLTVVDGRRILSAVLGGTIDSRGGTNGAENNKRARIEYQHLKAGTYTLSTSGVCDQAILCSYSSEQGADFEPIGSWGWVALPQTFTLESGRYIRAMVRKSTDEVLTSANIGDFQIDVVNVYPEHQTQTASVENLLGVGDHKDEQNIISGVVARACGIKVLDGTEDWKWDGATHHLVVSNMVQPVYNRTVKMISTHYPIASNGEAFSNIAINTMYGLTGGRIGLKNDTMDSTQFKAFLAEQYANGTPVIVVYPLAETTTEQVTAQHLTARDTATITAQTNNISDITLEVEYWENAE